MKHAWLIQEARRWVGVHEESENRGPIVDHIIKSSGGTPGNPWCVSFVRYCVNKVDHEFNNIYVINPALRDSHNILPRTHGVLKLWNDSPSWAKTSLVPRLGYIVCWEHFKENGNATGLGHCGIVTGIVDEGRWFVSIEANTSNGSAGIDRDGDGIYERTRSVQGSNRFRILGYIDPFAIEP